MNLSLHRLVYETKSSPLHHVYPNVVRNGMPLMPRKSRSIPGAVGAHKIFNSLEYMGGRPLASAEV